jgi:predicted nucleotidyltransferase component of viral defense system
VDVLIDKRELLEKTREKGLTLSIREKDYVLGWMLFGFSKLPDLVFKGGTALSKIYFPTIWRLSEDLDFSYLKGDFEEIIDQLDHIFSLIKTKSGIEFFLKSKYFNPEYLQLKIQYSAILGKNWIKIDINRETPIDQVLNREIHKTYSDYSPFKIKVESLEEIFAEKLRAILERKKCRDYYDIWKLTELDIDLERVKRLFRQKCKVKGIEFQGIEQVFPADIIEVLTPYWERELSRLLYPTPKVDEVIKGLNERLGFLKEK